MMEIKQLRCVEAQDEPFMCECGEEIPVKRFELGYRTCLKCGDAEARKRKFTVAPMHKSNYVLVSNRDDLIGLNNKGGMVK